MMALKKLNKNSSSKEKNKRKSSPEIDSAMPEEYEEQRSMALRMHPQPLNKNAKK